MNLLKKNIRRFKYKWLIFISRFRKKDDKPPMIFIYENEDLDDK